MLAVTFLYYEDCPSHEIALERLKQAVAAEAVQAAIEVVKVETDAQAEQLQFVGSPTIRINGRDIDAYYGLTCRAYRLEDGRISPLPSPGMIRRALRTAAAGER
jgi:hypothetical protein